MAFPNHAGKHAKKAFFTASDFMDYRISIGKKPSHKAPETVLFLFSTKLKEELEKKYTLTKVENQAGSLQLIGETNNKIGISGVNVGAPLVSMIMEELVAYGVKNFVLLGYAGSLQEEIVPGDVVVAKKAIRDEGTSHHYLRASKYSTASKKLTKKVQETLKKSELFFTSGTIWTIDAPYRETTAEIKRYQKEGVLCVEMETSAVFAVAKVRKVNAASVLVISDSLAKPKWMPEFHKEKVNENAMKIAESLIDTFK